MQGKKTILPITGYKNFDYWIPIKASA